MLATTNATSSTRVSTAHRSTTFSRRQRAQKSLFTKPYTRSQAKLLKTSFFCLKSFSLLKCFFSGSKFFSLLKCFFFAQMFFLWLKTFFFLLKIFFFLLKIFFFLLKYFFCGPNFSKRVHTSSTVLLRPLRVSDSRTGVSTTMHTYNQPTRWCPHTQHSRRRTQGGTNWTYSFNTFFFPAQNLFCSAQNLPQAWPLDSTNLPQGMANLPQGMASR
jgi:hypothetical protein